MVEKQYLADSFGYTKNLPAHYFEASWSLKCPMLPIVVKLCLPVWNTSWPLEVKQAIARKSFKDLHLLPLRDWAADLWCCVSPSRQTKKMSVVLCGSMTAALHWPVQRFSLCCWVHLVYFSSRFHRLRVTAFSVWIGLLLDLFFVSFRGLTRASKFIHIPRKLLTWLDSPGFGQFRCIFLSLLLVRFVRKSQANFYTQLSLAEIGCTNI